MARNSPPDVGQKIKALRAERKLTLDGLAKASGVSKSMLSQIERGLTNPTLATIWSLTQSLGIDISTLLGEPDDSAANAPAFDIVKSYQTPEIQSADGKCTLRILGPIDLVSRTEWYDMRLEGGGQLNSDGHGSGTVEHLTVLEGILWVKNGDSRKQLEAGDTARYEADVPHVIENRSDAPARALMMVITP
ncbi:helix-turn-helix domain-containing protein [Kordiimonas sp.]|uniref:helix-turn-helix domain-containing protein n=1 Tax=Kordiimonas sp. TaxID=1970157 RepID=UPI003A8F8CB8